MAGSTLIVWLSFALAPPLPEVTVTPREDCPSARAVERDVVELLGERPAEPLRAQIDVRGPQGAVAVTIAYEADGRRWTRELEGPSCERVLAAAALIIAVGVDPLRVHKSVEPVLQRPQRPPPPLLRPPPILPAVSGVSEDPEPDARRDSEKPAPPVGASSSDPAAPALPLRLSAFVLGGIAAGLTPEVAGHLGGGAALGGWAWRVELSGQHQFARRVVHSEMSAAGAEVSRTSGRPSACWTPQLGAFMFGLCGGVDVGVVVGRGIGLESRAVARAPWVAATPGVRGMWRPKGPVSLGIHLDVPVSLRRPEFNIDDFAAPLFRVGAVGVVAGLAVEFAFFDESARGRR